MSEAYVDPNFDVGGFDSATDANLRSMQGILEARLLRAPSMEQMQLLPKALPMLVPH